MSKTQNEVFLCHSSNDRKFVLQVAAQLRRQFDDVFVHENGQPSDSDWNTKVDDKLKNSRFFVLFAGKELSTFQQREVSAFIRLFEKDPKGRHCVVVAISGQKTVAEIEDKIPALLGGKPILTDNFNLPENPRPVECAYEIVKAFNVDELKWKAVDGLPVNPHLFDYEKPIIEFYVGKDGLDLNAEAPDEETRKRINDVRKNLWEGCPETWPQVHRMDQLEQPSKPPMHENELPGDICGEFRAHDSKVVAAALTRFEAEKHKLTLLEAGPRKELYFPRNYRLNVGVIVLGGIAPGINAVIDAIVQRHWDYKESQKHQLRIYGFLNGFWALAEDTRDRTVLLMPDETRRKQAERHALDTAELATEGGSMLGTWRDKKLADLEKRESKLRQIARTLFHLDIDILYVIGGDGSMKAAHALFHIAQDVAREDARPPLSVVAVPKTMDNDILWMWQSFGFSSAVQKAREIVQQLHTEVKSNPRLCVLQLYGSDSGFVVSHTVLASATGHCDLALIPEQPFTMIEAAAHLKKRIHESGRPLPYGLVVMAEAAVPDDALFCLGEEEPTKNVEAYQELSSTLRLTDDEITAIKNYINLKQSGKRVQGQTEDDLRRASLHIVSKSLEILLKRSDIGSEYHEKTTDWKSLRILTNEPRHLLRATAPSTSDITMAQRLGILAVDNALAGYTDFMISQWLTEYVLVPLDLVVLGRKRIPKAGIFWKQVLAKTGQLFTRDDP